MSSRNAPLHVSGKHLRYQVVAPTGLVKTRVNEYTICDSYSMMKLVGHPMTWLVDRCIDQFEIFSRFLAEAEVDFWCLHARDKKKKNSLDRYNVK